MKERNEGSPQGFPQTLGTSSDHHVEGLVAGSSTSGSKYIVREPQADETECAWCGSFLPEDHESDLCDRCRYGSEYCPCCFEFFGDCICPSECDDCLQDQEGF